jgi:hypothetical protein
MTIVNELARPFHSVVAQLIGTWQGAGEVLPNPWGYSGATTGRWQFLWSVGDKYVVADYREERHDGSTFEGHGVMMQRQESQDILWFWFDSYGHPPIPEARGSYDGAALVFEKMTSRGNGRTTLLVVDNYLCHEAAFKSHGNSSFTTVAHGRYARYTASSLARAQ